MSTIHSTGRDRRGDGLPPGEEEEEEEEDVASVGGTASADEVDDDERERATRDWNASTSLVVVRKQGWEQKKGRVATSIDVARFTAMDISGTVTHLLGGERLNPLFGQTDTCRTTKTAVRTATKEPESRPYTRVQFAGVYGLLYGYCTRSKGGRAQVGQLLSHRASRGVLFGFGNGTATDRT